MSAPDRLPLKSIPPATDGPHPAVPTAPPAAVGEPKGAARKGVVTALFSNRSPVRPDADPTPETPGIRIFAPPVYRRHYDGARWSTRHGALPSAAYACLCGQTGAATGPDAVAALVTEYEAHRSGCTGAPATLERRNTA
ncbi:hypothetical protein OG796_16295 [Streptomyces jietaisiensis]|uniref:Uncharacterized protein n=1 Tax=Streptomyces griseoaurantiacus TaxID=68213 RepID=A0ABZ1V5J2_9ACTN|nr:hypothetical protein [Streptomyces jietaisiensis]